MHQEDRLRYFFPKDKDHLFSHTCQNTLLNILEQHKHNLGADESQGLTLCQVKASDTGSIGSSLPKFSCQGPISYGIVVISRLLDRGRVRKLIRIPNAAYCENASHMETQRKA